MLKFEAVKNNNVKENCINKDEENIINDNKENLKNVL